MPEEVLSLPLPQGLSPVEAGRIGLWLLGKRNHRAAARRRASPSREALRRDRQGIGKKPALASGYRHNETSAVRGTRLFVATMLAPAFTIRKYRLQTVCRVLLLVPWATPPIVAILVWRWMLDTRVGVINGLLTGLGVVGHPIHFWRVPLGCGRR